MSNDELETYKVYVASRLKELSPFLQNYALGDFSSELKIPEQEDEFTELLVGITLMVDDFREMVAEREQIIGRLRAAEEKIIQEREHLQAIFDGIEDVIYVSDPDSYELLLVNKAFKKGWGENAVGTICYKKLQNRDEPCPFCTNDLIFGEYLGKVYTWEFQNEVTKEWYRCADKAIRWPSGKMVRFEAAANISEEKQIRDDLAQSMAELERFNKLAVDREHRMIALKREVNTLAQEIGRQPPYDLAFSDDV